MPQKMTLKMAREIAGTLGNPSKMPGKAYGIPADKCKVGSILIKLKGTVCHKCYALKGNYTFPSVVKSQQKRLASLYHALWVVAMVYLILHANEKEFRWHDSGDLQSMKHLLNIIQVARQTPDVLHWIPTKEIKLVMDFYRTYGIDYIPDNLIIRISGYMINGKVPKRWPWTSTVHNSREFIIGDECMAYTRKGKCGPCRKCWDKSVDNVSYPVH